MWEPQEWGESGGNACENDRTYLSVHRPQGLTYLIRRRISGVDLLLVCIHDLLSVQLLC